MYRSYQANLSSSRHAARGRLAARSGLGAILLAVGLAVGQSPAADLLTEHQKFTASDGAPEDSFGSASSISGDVAVIGATDASSGSGAAYVFRSAGGSWSEEAKLTAADAAAGDSFGHSLAVSGDVAVVGAYGNDASAATTDTGAAYIFRFDGSSWNQEVKLVASDAAAGDRFGESVAISGDLVVVGATFDDDKGTSSGSVYVYRYDGSVWNEEAKLLAADGVFYDFFGASVAASADSVVVGTPSKDVAGSGSGAAYVFYFDGATWSQEAKLIPSDPAAGDNFGQSVSVWGGATIIGAYQDDDGGSGSGSAYVFRWDGANWSEEQKLTASDGGTNDSFGYSVSISGDALVVGAYFDHDGGVAGAAYAFSFDGSAWNETKKLVASDAAYNDRLGISVAISGTEVIAGASEDGALGIRSGSAYAFSIEPPNSPPVAEAGDSQTLECDSPQGTLVWLDGSASSDPDGDALSYEWSVAGSAALFDDPYSAMPIGLFPVGPTRVTLTVTDGRGGIAVDDVLVTVVDTTPPVVVCTTDVGVLWPPKHQLLPVVISVVASDGCELPETQLVAYVSSSEPDDATGDGAFTGDVNGMDGFTSPVPVQLAYDAETGSYTGSVELRAERDGVQAGRTYSIVCGVTDAAGNTTTSSCVVVVPHDRRKNH